MFFFHFFSEKSTDLKRRLVGDCALASAFVSYCGPFNQEFRGYMIGDKFSQDLVHNSIPFTKNLDIIPFLVDIGTIGDWNMQVRLNVICVYTYVYMYVYIYKFKGCHGAWQAWTFWVNWTMNFGYSKFNLLYPKFIATENLKLNMVRRLKET